MDRLDVAQIVSSTPWHIRLLIRVFGREFNRRVAYRIIARACERGKINSHQMHLLLAQFDPTQNGVVGSM